MSQTPESYRSISIEIDVNNNNLKDFQIYSSGDKLFIRNKNCNKVYSAIGVDSDISYFLQHSSTISRYMPMIVHIDDNIIVMIVYTTDVSSKPNTITFIKDKETKIIPQELKILCKEYYDRKEILLYEETVDTYNIVDRKNPNTTFNKLKQEFITNYKKEWFSISEKMLFEVSQTDEILEKRGDITIEEINNAIYKQKIYQRILEIFRELEACLSVKINYTNVSSHEISSLKKINESLRKHVLYQKKKNTELRNVIELTTNRLMENTLELINLNRINIKKENDIIFLKSQLNVMDESFNE